MNKKDLNLLAEAYGDVMDFDNGETETPQEMEHEKIGMLKNNLRKVIDHATSLLDNVEDGTVTDVPPWAEEKIAVAVNMLDNMVDTLQAIVDNRKEEKINNWKNSNE